MTYTTKQARVLRVGDYPTSCCTPLAGWLFDCMGVVPAVSADKDGHLLWGGYSWAELRIIWLREHRN